MSEFRHISVLLDEVLHGLNPQPGGRYIDGTLGGGGHAAALLECSAPDGFLIGCDQDEVALEATRARLKDFPGRYELHRCNFAELAGRVEAGTVDGVLLDIGVSSPQLDDATRGFSFMQDGPLDMRMNMTQTLTAAGIVNEAPEGELIRVFREYGEERFARRIARAIVQSRSAAPLSTTGQLAELIARAVPRREGRIHPATRCFQGLRIAVNDELKALEDGLSCLWSLLKHGGRMAVITFHSLEAGIVKRWSRERARDYTFEGTVDIPELRQPRQPDLKILGRKPVLPGTAELEANPRSRSAQLRTFERI